MKEELRKQLMLARKKISSKELVDHSHKITEQILACDLYKKSMTIGVYASVGNEISTDALINKMIKDGKKIAVPVMRKEMQYHPITAVEELTELHQRIREPKIQNQQFIKKLDLLIIPCVGIDKNGYRLGRGGGHYDRYLNVHPTPSICLAHAFQIIPHIPKEPHDHQMNYIATEDDFIDCKIIDGRKIAQQLLGKIRQEITQYSYTIHIQVILVGDDPASELYVSIKQKRCKEVGIAFTLLTFKKDVKQKELEDTIQRLNKDKNTHGILVQLPLPQHLDTDTILNLVNPKKDIDGLSRYNLEHLTEGTSTLICPTPRGILKLLEAYSISLKGKSIVLVGHGKLVGRPLSLLLSSMNISPVICTEKTPHLYEQTKKADILITAVGKAHLLSKEAIRKGAIVIDAGTSSQDNKIVGDVDFDQAKLRAEKITPAIGGVGPMTVACLIENILIAYKQQNKVGSDHY